MAKITRILELVQCSFDGESQCNFQVSVQNIPTFPQLVMFKWGKENEHKLTISPGEIGFLINFLKEECNNG